MSCRIFFLPVIAFATLALAEASGKGRGLSQPGDKSFASALQWPAPTRENRPWTRWWWLGSAVDKTNLTQLLTEYRDAGLGGVEICPIYGAKGYEEKFIDFLSPKWMEMYVHTANEAKRLNLGLDLTTGTGWPFGGPNVSLEMASKKVILKRYQAEGGVSFKTELSQARLQWVMAISAKGEQTNLTQQVTDSVLSWIPPAGQWRIYALLQSSPIQKVKRPAPGGEGSVLDPYSASAMDRYLARFDKAFSEVSAAPPRAWFHDSFEYYGAQWTLNFFSEFQGRRGYDLRTQLPALFGDGPEDTVARVQGDYRETISDLHLAYIQSWTGWCHAHGSLSRNQAHGSPGNLLDIYAAADIPETEIFGSVEEKHIPMNKFSSSAAHVAGRTLASSESFTWLDEHFHASLSDVKQAADYLFLSGVNHILFHGIPYSPAQAPWPGWQFYASVNFGPQGGLWRDLPEFNAYVTRCQSILQSGASDNDILVYYPVHDAWDSPGELILPNPIPKSFTNAVMDLWENGYAFDYVSDRLLQNAECENHQVLLGGNRYYSILVPECRRMPEATCRKLVQMARAGAQVMFEKNLPQDVPGFGNLERRRHELRQTLREIGLASQSGALQSYPVGDGELLISTNLDSLLSRSGARREPAVAGGLQFVRRRHAEGFCYFLANRSQKALDGWVTLGTDAKSAVILDPRQADRLGIAVLKQERLHYPKRAMQTSIYLQLQPGESCVVRTFTNQVLSGRSWRYLESAGPPALLSGTWKIQFIEGGPEFPANFETRELGSWTKLGDPEVKRFAGTARYTIEFEAPAIKANDWLLDLGRVCESARVRLNGQQLATLWCAPFGETIGPWLRPGKNILELEVTNLAVNRIADLDRRKVNWKYFYDINIASRRYKTLDATNWPLQDSGLLGPVSLVPLCRKY